MKMAVLCRPHELNFVNRITQHLVKFTRISSSTAAHMCSGNGDRNKLLCTREAKVVDNSNVKRYSSYKGNFIAKFSADIDLDALREQRMKDQRISGNDLQIGDVVKEILTEKCDEAISNLSAEDQKKLKVIQLEHDFLFSEGYAIPSSNEMTSENWLEALNLSSKNRRLKYYIACQKKTFKVNNKKKKSLLKTKVGITEPSEIEEVKHMEYNKILLRVYTSTIKRWLNHRLSTSLQFGIPLVIDMNYGDLMPNRDIKNTADQLLDLYCLNRSDEQLPFHLHFTGCPENNPIYRNLQLLLQNDPHFMATVAPQCYTELFDKDKLIYLSPDGKQVMREFDPNAVYIVGAYNDKTTQKPISYARAKEQGIQCQRLPLDRYLQWNIGSKALTLNQIMSILSAVKNAKSWPEAFKVIPSRKLIAR